MWDASSTFRQMNIFFIKSWWNRTYETERLWTLCWTSITKTAVHKDRRPYCPYWQAIFWCLLPGRTHARTRRFVLVAVSVLFSQQKKEKKEMLQGSNGINPRPLLYFSRWSQLSCLVQVPAKYNTPPCFRTRFPIEMIHISGLVSQLELNRAFRKNDRLLSDPQLHFAYLCFLTKLHHQAVPPLRCNSKLSVNVFKYSKSIKKGVQWRAQQL